MYGLGLMGFRHDGDAMVAPATGGLLREAGKKDGARLLRYLDAYAATSPASCCATPSSVSNPSSGRTT